MFNADSINSTSQEIQSLLDLRLFLFTPHGYVRVYKGRITVTQFVPAFCFIRELKLDRGDILDVFSKLEFFVNEFFHILLFRQLREIDMDIAPEEGPDGLFFTGTGEESDILDRLLEHIDFFPKIRLLNDLKIIDNKLCDKLMHVKSVRNKFAHDWDVNVTTYRGLPFPGGFDTFKADMEYIWEYLAKAYWILIRDNSYSSSIDVGLDYLEKELKTKSYPRLLIKDILMLLIYVLKHERTSENKNEIEKEFDAIWVEIKSD